jgi:enoyl-CoA hydratase/carnithine racemase
MTADGSTATVAPGEDTGAAAGGVVDVRVEGRIGRIRLDDPKRLNALGPAVLAGLEAALDRVEADPAVRVVVLEAAGEHFSAGGDIAVFDLGVAAGRDYVRRVIASFRRLEHLAKPVVAAVRGFALGGGFELAMACDLVVASTTARFGLPETKVGAIPGYAVIRLPEIVGRQRAKEIIWSARRLEPAEAVALGLAVAEVADDQLEASVLRLAGQVAGVPRVAAEVIKAAVNGGIADRALFESTTAAALMWGTAGIKEGQRAFYEKRPPAFPDE